MVEFWCKVSEDGLFFDYRMIKVYMRKVNGAIAI